MLRSISTRSQQAIRRLSSAPIRARLARSTAVDRGRRGGDLGAGPKRGFVLFNNDARASACHQGWRFTDDLFHGHRHRNDHAIADCGTVVKDDPAHARSPSRRPDLADVGVASALHA